MVLNSCNESINVLVYPHIYDSICTGTTYDFNGDLLTTAGVYFDTLTGSNGQDSLVKLTLSEINLPIVSAGNDTILCNQPGTVQFNGLPLGGTWTGTHINSSGGFDPNGVGLFENVYTYTDPNGCANSDTMYIDVIAPINADAGVDFEGMYNCGDYSINWITCKWNMEWEWDYTYRVIQSNSSRNI